MKKLFFLALCATASIYSYSYTTIIVKGKNMGTTTTTSMDVNGNPVSTTSVSCDNFYDMTCLTIQTNGPVKAGSPIRLSIPDAVIYGAEPFIHGILSSYNKEDLNSHTVSHNFNIKLD